MDNANVTGSSPTGTGAGAIPRRPLRIAAGLAACGYAPICAYCWAMPRDRESLVSFLVSLLLAALGVGVFLITLTTRLARSGQLRLAFPAVLPFLLLALVGAVPAIGAVAGGWPGGWGLGVAGAVAGALVGVASGWLVMRCMLRAVCGFRSLGPPDGLGRPSE